MSFDLGNSLHKPHSNENEALVPNFRDQLHESFFFCPLHFITMHSSATKYAPHHIPNNVRMC